MAQWLRIRAPNAGGVGSFLGRGARSQHPTWLAAKKPKHKNRSSTVTNSVKSLKKKKKKKFPYLKKKFQC